MSLLRVADWRRTGMATIPKLMTPFHILRPDVWRAGAFFSSVVGFAAGFAPFFVRSRVAVGMGRSWGNERMPACGEDSQPGGRVRGSKTALQSYADAAAGD